MTEIIIRIPIIYFVINLINSNSNSKFFFYNISQQQNNKSLIIKSKIQAVKMILIISIFKIY